MSEETKNQSESIETRLSSLEGIVEKLENDQLSLEESFDVFEKAVKISKSLKKQFEKYERKIEVIEKDIKGEIVANEYHEPE